MKVAIIGSRNCPPLDIGAHIDFTPSLIVSGGARGADTFAREYARANNIPLCEILPEYGKHGNKAPLIRNRQIVDMADFVLAFWDGISHGTAYTLKYAQQKRKRIKIVRI